jgi:hypothetical protein
MLGKQGVSDMNTDKTIADQITFWVCQRAHKQHCYDNSSFASGPRYREELKEIDETIAKLRQQLKAEE